MRIARVIRPLVGTLHACAGAGPTGMCWTRLALYFLFIALPPLTYGHVPEYMSTPSNKVEQYCLLAEACVHDTIPICGRMENEKRTFLDSCDLLEYACDTNIKTCVHDTIPICGRMEDEKLTFLDSCDLFVYACDTNEIYTHVDDMPDCPVFKTK